MNDPLFRNNAKYQINYDPYSAVEPGGFIKVHGILNNKWVLIEEIKPYSDQELERVEKEYPTWARYCYISKISEKRK